MRCAVVYAICQLDMQSVYSTYPRLSTMPKTMIPMVIIHPYTPLSMSPQPLCEAPIEPLEVFVLILLHHIREVSHISMCQSYAQFRVGFRTPGPIIPQTSCLTSKMCLTCLDALPFDVFRFTVGGILRFVIIIVLNATSSQLLI